MGILVFDEFVLVEREVVLGVGGKWVFYGGGVRGLIVR